MLNKAKLEELGEVLRDAKNDATNAISKTRIMKYLIVIDRHNAPGKREMHAGSSTNLNRAFPVAVHAIVSRPCSYYVLLATG